MDCQRRPKATTSARSWERVGGSVPYSQGRLATSQARSSARRSCCAAVIWRSIRASLAQASRPARTVADARVGVGTTGPAAPRRGGGVGGTVCFAAVEFELSSDQQDLAGAAGDLLDGLASRDRVRAFVGSGTADDAGERAGGFDRPLWEAMAGQGWLAVERPESAGGLGMGMVEVAVLCEQLGRRTAPAPFLGTILAMVALQQAGEDEAVPDATVAEADRWADRMAAGEAVGTRGLGGPSRNGHGAD